MRRAAHTVSSWNTNSLSGRNPYTGSHRAHRRSKGCRPQGYRRVTGNGGSRRNILTDETAMKKSRTVFQTFFGQIDEKKQKIYGAFCKGLLYNALCMDMYKL